MDSGRGAIRSYEGIGASVEKEDRTKKNEISEILARSGVVEWARTHAHISIWWVQTMNVSLDLDMKRRNPMTKRN